MKRVLAVLLAMFAATVPAVADDFGNRHDSRAFWLKNQNWPNPREQADNHPAPRWTTTYTEGVAKRFGMGGGHMDFFERRLGGEGGPGQSPASEGESGRGAEEGTAIHVGVKVCSGAASCVQKEAVVQRTPRLDSRR